MRKIVLLILSLILTLVVLVGCTTNEGESNQVPEENPQDQELENTGEVNLYTDRHYDTDEELYNIFTEETGIKVNVVKGKLMN